jgi:hypothetical protein
VCRGGRPGPFRAPFRPGPPDLNPTCERVGARLHKSGAHTRAHAQAGPERRVGLHARSCDLKKICHLPGQEGSPAVAAAAARARKRNRQPVNGDKSVPTVQLCRRRQAAIRPPAGIAKRPAESMNHLGRTRGTLRAGLGRIKTCFVKMDRAGRTPAVRTPSVWRDRSRLAARHSFAAGGECSPQYRCRSGRRRRRIDRLPTRSPGFAIRGRRQEEAPHTFCVGRILGASASAALARPWRLAGPPALFMFMLLSGRRVGAAAARRQPDRVPAGCEFLLLAPPEVPRVQFFD